MVQVTSVPPSGAALTEPGAPLTASVVTGPKPPPGSAVAVPGGGFGPVTTLAVNGAPGSVSAAPDGGTLVTWTTGTFGYAAPPSEQTDAFAALRPAGAATLGPPETLSSPALEDFAPAAAYDPISGLPLAVWPAAQRTPFLSGYEQVRMQLATRAP